MIVYDTFRALSLVPRALDCTAEGLWDSVQSDRDQLVREARGLLDEAADLLGEKLPPELHRHVNEFHLACTAAALALEALEDWVGVVESTLAWVTTEAVTRYDRWLTR